MSGAISRSREKPALRARAAVKGTFRSSWTTVTPRAVAYSGLPSVEPESTYTVGRAAGSSDARQRRNRSPSFRPITTTPTRTTRDSVPGRAADLELLDKL